MTVVALAFAVMIGDGACAFVSICLGRGRADNAKRTIGSAILSCIIVSIILTACYFIFTEPILTLFGGKVNEGTYANAREYFFYLQALGKAVESTILSLAREIIFGVFFPIIFPMFLGLTGILYSFPAADILTFLITVYIVRRTYKELGKPSSKPDAKTV